MKLTKLKLALSALIACTAPHGFSAEEDSIAYQEGYGLVLEQNWAAAQDYFAGFLSGWPDSVWADDAAFWNCYSIEKSGNDEEENLYCYQQFMSSWPESSWAEDAASKLAVLGSRLGDLGYSDFLANTLDNVDFADIENMSEMVERAMAEAEREMERAQEQLSRVEIERRRIRVPDIPDLPNTREIREQLREQLEDVRVQVNRQRRVQLGRRQRISADDELLAVIGALRDDERASDLLIRRLDESTNPDMRRRIVLLLEGLDGDNVTTTLTNVINNDESEAVRNDAIMVLLDRDDPNSREFLLRIVADPSYSVAIRSEIVDNIEDWGEAQAIEVLTGLLATETDLSLIAETADALSDIGSEAAFQALADSYETSDNAQLRHEVLEQIADIETPEVINYLTNIALSGNDDESAAIAIEGIADREDDFAVAALDQIYNNSDSLQRRLAALNGIGDSEIQLAVVTLQGLLTDESDPQIVSAIARALGDTEQRDAVAAVLEIYRSNDNETVQRAAIRALRGLDDFEESTDALLEILEDRLNDDGV